jgi:hypothetical protein
MCHAPRRRRAESRRDRVALLSLGLLLAGCKQGAVDAKLDEGFRKVFEPRKTPQQYMLVAVSSDDPDARRDAVAKISQSKKFNQEWSIKGLVAIALLENEPQTRCVALRTLARTGDPRATETALKILNYTEYPPQEVWPPAAICRGDAALALARLTEGDQVPEEYRDQAFNTLLERLKRDDDRHTRIAAARGLGCYPRAETIPALIDGLRDEDFAVAHECENSLVKLTGVTHNADAGAWEAWLAEHPDDAFAQAGTVPESRRPPYKNRWEKGWYETKDMVEWLWPGAKE